VCRSTKKSPADVSKVQTGEAYGAEQTQRQGRKNRGRQLRRVGERSKCGKKKPTNTEPEREEVNKDPSIVLSDKDRNKNLTVFFVSSSFFFCTELHLFVFLRGIYEAWTTSFIPKWGWRNLRLISSSCLSSQSWLPASKLQSQTEGGKGYAVRSPPDQFERRMRVVIEKASQVTVPRVQE